MSQINLDLIWQLHEAALGAVRPVVVEQTQIRRVNAGNTLFAWRCNERSPADAETRGFFCGQALTSLPKATEGWTRNPAPTKAPPRPHPRAGFALGDARADALRATRRGSITPVGAPKRDEASCVPGGNAADPTSCIRSGKLAINLAMALAWSGDIITLPVLRYLVLSP